MFNDDLTKDFEGYRVLWLDNQKWAEGNAQIAVGAEVVLCGHLTVYKKDDSVTVETAGNKAYVYQVNGVSTEAEGIGTEACPFTTAGAIAAANAISGTSAFDAYISGKISKIVNEFTAEYGNATFWMSKDGVFNDDKSIDFEGYRVLYFGGEKWVDGNRQIAVGDEVVLKGKLTTYNGTAETAGNKACLYSLNGKGE